MEKIGLSMPFNPAQLELLRLFAGGVNEEEMKQLRRILLDFKFKKVTSEADKILDTKGWTNEDLARNAQALKRTPYKSKKQNQANK
jgi:hypothetical protein